MNITPVMYLDPSGESFVGLLISGAIIGGLIGGVTAALTGQNILAGIASGALSGAIATVGMAIAIATGGFAGAMIAAGSSFSGGFLGSLLEQGIQTSWSDISIGKAVIDGGVSAAVSLVTFGFGSFIARNSVGAYESVVNKTISWSTRVSNSFNLSMESFMMTIMVDTPMAVINSLTTAISGIDINSNNEIDIDAVAGACKPVRS